MSLPHDLTYHEFAVFMAIFEYQEDLSPNGSRVRFFNSRTKTVFTMHKPHGKNGTVVKIYIIREAINHLRKEGQL